MTTIADTDERLAAQLQALTSEDESIRFNAGLDLVKAGRLDGVPALIDAFMNDSMVVRLFHASRTLAASGMPTVPALSAARTSDNERIRVDAAYTLFCIDATRRDALLTYPNAALDSDDQETVSDALHFLGKVGAAAAVAVPSLIDALHTTRELEDSAAWGLDPRVQIAALLAKIGEPIDAIVDALVGALASDAPLAPVGRSPRAGRAWCACEGGGAEACGTGARRKRKRDGPC